MNFAKNLYFYSIAVTQNPYINPFLHTYSSPDPELNSGQLVIVPFGKKSSPGVVYQKLPSPDLSKPIKQIIQDLDYRIPDYYLDWLEWISAYYQTPAKQIWSSFLIGGLDKPSRAKIDTWLSINPSPLDPRSLNPDQAQVFDQINQSDQPFHLINGITGSGKTEVYIKLAKQALTQQKSALLLVPEINLTRQLISRITPYFDKCLIYHSRLTPAQRRGYYQYLFSNQNPVLILGTRSALLTPIPKLGLIVIDEEHDPSYKQTSHPKYQTKVIAAKLTRLTKGKLVLGSATPAIDTSFLVDNNKIIPHLLTKRATNLPMPEITLIDLGQSKQNISPELTQAIATQLKADKQSLLFINSRGTARSQICEKCHQTVVCPNCGLSLSFHQDSFSLHCHYCEFQISPNRPCQFCSSGKYRLVGFGTKQIESEIATRFPQAKILRLDRDNTKQNSLEDLVDQLNQADIIIGTQMVAKGWDLPRLSLVGVLLADQLWQIPEYTSNERAYNLLVQVIGRSGRHHQPGKVYIQTYYPDHPLLRDVINHDYQNLLTSELALRQRFRYPPYYYLLKINFKARQAKTAWQHAINTRNQLLKNPKLITSEVLTLKRQENRLIQYQLLIRAHSRSELLKLIPTLPSSSNFELDPISLL
ncbi:primosomal protein N' [Candidatus Saccharibacteria bacterium]|nr:primosomal protein N' [Candidatus Saccharibacteria bacterium]MCB9835001.1 primosomal protein N' [Candidatus Nomurabacteria bacterium]